MAEEKKKVAPKTEVTLKDAHRHGGEDYVKGDVIEVTETAKEFLKKHKKI